jgi:hypothetical protein
MHVRIFRPSKTTMQSGRAATQRWRVEAELETPRRPEPLMGWTSSGDTMNQIRMGFDTREEAIAFAERQGWTYTVQEPNARKVKPRNYADNFRQDRPRVGRF